MTEEGHRHSGLTRIDVHCSGFMLNKGFQTSWNDREVRMEKILTIIDCNNFWSPSGGGVRRYHLQKLEYFKAHSHRYIFVMQDSRSYTEILNTSTIIEHIAVPKIMGNWEYRFLYQSKPLKRIFEKYNPDVIEVGSPYLLPLLVKRAIKSLEKKPKLIAFWHADFPVTYVGRYFEKWGKGLEDLSEKVAWGYARWMFRYFSGFLVSSPYIGKRMQENGLKPIFDAPLGVDTKLFHPSQKDLEKVEKIKAGHKERLTIFFPHRFCQEKGLKTLLEAYPLLCQRLSVEPALVFAGTGPSLERVKEAVKDYKHIHYLGFIKSRDEMASWYASCELGLALSGHETFGLSILESMASGQILVGANTGAAQEHIQNSQAGVTVPLGEADLLVEGILSLISKTDGLSKKARDYAQKFTWENCFKRENKIYESLLEQHSEKGTSTSF